MKLNSICRFLSCTILFLPSFANATRQDSFTNGISDNSLIRLNELFDNMKNANTSNSLYSNYNDFLEFNFSLLNVSRYIYEKIFQINVDRSQETFDNMKVNLEALISFRSLIDQDKFPGLLSMYGWDKKSLNELVNQASEIENLDIVALLFALAIPLSNETISKLEASDKPIHKKIVGGYKKLKSIGWFDGEFLRRVRNKRYNSLNYNENDYNKVRDSFDSRRSDDRRDEFDNDRVRDNRSRRDNLDSRRSDDRRDNLDLDNDRVRDNRSRRDNLDSRRSDDRRDNLDLDNDRVRDNRSRRDNLDSRRTSQQRKSQIISVGNSERAIIEGPVSIKIE